MIYYMDSSAIAKLLMDEPKSEEVVETVSRAAMVGSSVVSFVEVHSALVRGLHRGLLTREETELGREEFRGVWRTFAKMRVDDAKIERAAALVDAHSLRAYDALQLASALRWREELRHEITFYCFDKALGRAAAAEGMTCLPAP